MRRADRRRGSATAAGARFIPRRRREGSPRAGWRHGERAYVVAVTLMVLGLAGCGCNETRLANMKEPDASWKSRAAYVAEREERRLYEGAPPVVPHSIADLGRDDCLACHLEGSAVDPETNRPAPVTPHPQQINCVQCHVEQVTTTEFRANQVEGLDRLPPVEKLHALAPPAIPHRVQDRENCRSCHLSDTSPDVLVPAHGERSNCTQCHVQLAQAAPPFTPSHELSGEN